MASSKKHEPGLEALILKAATEAKRLNPHIGEPPPAYTDEECAALLRDDEAIDELWNTLESKRAQQLGYSAADAVDEDRGE